ALYPVHTGRAGRWIKGDTTGLHGWEDYDGLKLLVVPVPAALTNTDSAISLPDAAHDALVVGLALNMARSLGKLRDLPGLPDEAKDAEDAAITALGTQDTTQTWMTKVTR
ncbi:MAG TPA: hypothetical protein VEA41_06330, partial [Salinarimonas sp.]|nr:hypothetical protein [Salinarimonas sp.]